MTTLLVLDVPENTSVAEVASQQRGVSIDRVGPYFRISSDADLVIDRRSTGCRHAVWYSCVAGLVDSRIIQWDKDALHVVAR